MKIIRICSISVIIYSVRSCPWNVSRVYIHAPKWNCEGVMIRSGWGNGVKYVRWSRAVCCGTHAHSTGMYLKTRLLDSSLSLLSCTVEIYKNTKIVFLCIYSAHIWIRDYTVLWDLKIWKKRAKKREQTRRDVKREGREERASLYDIIWYRIVPSMVKKGRLSQIPKHQSTKIPCFTFLRCTLMV